MINFNSILSDRQFTIMVFNIKLMSNHRKPNSDIYRDLFHQSHKNKAISNVGKNREMIMRTQYEIENSIYGNITIYLNPQFWYDNEKQDIVANPLANSELFPEAKESIYVFIPEAHRLAVIRNGNITSSQVLTFFKDVFNRHLEDGEEIKIFEEQDINGFEQIYNAKSISRLKINVSYSNNDLSEDFEEAWDDELRNSGITDMNIDSKGDISLSDAKIIGGALKLAQSNGYAEATVINQENKRVRIKTIKYPLLKALIGEEGREYRSIRKWIIERFRPNLSE